MAHPDHTDLGIVFFSGAGLDNWIWEPLSSHLAFPVCPVDLPGRGRLGSIPTKALSLQDYVSHVQPQLDELKPRNLVFVCHSIGAVLGLLLAKRLPNRVHGIVFIASAIPQSGTSFCQSLPFPANLILPLIMNLWGTRPPEPAIRAGLCEGLSTSLADRVVGGFCPESQRLYQDSIVYRSETRNLGYVLTRNDKTIDAKRQLRFAKRAGISVIEPVDAGHLVMLESPERLGETINAMIHASLQ